MTKSRNILAPCRPWTRLELELLRREYADGVTADIARALDRPLTHVYACAGRLGLRKSDAFAASDKSGRILKGGKLSQATQFKPGLVPWNKGSHHVAGGRSAETRFAKGNRPHTWVPIGSLRINSDGYLDRKVNDLPGPSHVRWHPVHRLVWEAAHGPTPVGHVVVFKPGRRTTVEADIMLDAIELISRRELMARNTMHNMPKPLVELMRLRGRLTRAINDRSKT
jgi:HNH endonuclease